MNDSGSSSASRPALAAMLAFELALGLVAIAIAWPAGIDLLAAFGTPPSALLWQLPLALLPLIGLMLQFERARSGWLAELRQFVNQRLVPLFQGIGVAGLGLVALFAGLFEELLFRGVIQAGIANWIGLWPGLLLASLLFGLAHAMTRAYFWITFVMGLYLGGLYLVSDSLWLPMLVHFLYDWLALLLLTRGSRSPGT